MSRAVQEAEPVNPVTDALPLDLHELPFAVLLLALFVGAMIRANATYWIGRGIVAGGRHSRFRRYLDGPSMARAEAFVARWGVLAVPLCFLTVGVQTAVNLSAGATRMPLRRYLPAVCVGAMLWAVLYATIGLAAFGLALLALAESPWMLLAVLAAAGGALWWWRRRAARVSADRDETPAPRHERP